MTQNTWKIVALALFGCVVTSCQKPTDSANQTPEFAFVTNGVASFWDICKVGAEKAGADLGVKVSVLMPASGVVDQKQMMEDMVIRGIDGIAVSPIDPDNQLEVLNKAAASSNLITVDADAPQAKRLMYLGMDNYKAGRMAGQLVKEAMPQGGSVAIFVGRIEQDNARLRRQGLIDELLDRSADPKRFDEPGAVIDGGRYKILGTLIDQFDRAKAKTYVEDTITRTPDVGCMVGLFAYNPPIILEALGRMNQLGKVKVVAFDEADETLEGVMAGHVHGTVVQNPYEYGYQSIKFLKSIAAGDQSVIPDSRFIDIPARMIRRDEVEAYRKDLNEKLGR
ncbi:MAG: sugar-binding protein [Akkermansiaceae bacterium]